MARVILENATTDQDDAATYVQDRYNAIITPYGDGRYFYVDFPESMTAIDMMVALHWIGGAFQSWQAHMSNARIGYVRIMVKYH